MDAFFITLSRYLGTLTPGWVLALLDIELTPDALTPSFYDDSTFGVWQGTEEFLPLNTQSVSLPHYPSQLRSTYE
jgi:hypothetical protein